MNNNKEIIDKAQKLKNEEKFEEAIKLIEDLLQKDPKSEIVKNNLIEILFSYGGYLNDEFVLEYEKAVDIFKKIIHLDPKNPKAHYNLGIAYYYLEKLEKALESYNQAIEINPDYKYCYYNIGLIYESKDDLIKALGYYNKALEIDPKFPYAIDSRNYIRKLLDSQKTKHEESGQFILCENCGNSNRLDAKYCDNCGQKL